MSGSNLTIGVNGVSSSPIALPSGGLKELKSSDISSLKTNDMVLMFLGMDYTIDYNNKTVTWNYNEEGTLIGYLLYFQGTRTVSLLSNLPLLNIIGTNKSNHLVVVRFYFRPSTNPSSSGYIGKINVVFSSDSYSDVSVDGPTIDASYMNNYPNRVKLFKLN